MNRRRGLPRIGAFLRGATEPLRTLGAKVWSRLHLPGLRKNRRKLLARPTAPTPTEGVVAETSKPVVTGIKLLLLWALPLVAAATAFAIPLLGVRAYEYVMQSGYFHVREVVVDQTSTRSLMAPDAPYRPRLTREEILTTAGIGAGTHLLEADLEAMTQKLEAHPWVRWARIEKDLPDVLIVHVVEHVPSAILAPHLESSGGPTAAETLPQLLLVDELGEVFAQYPTGLNLALPVITGVGVARLEPMDPELPHQLIAGLNVMRLWQGQGLARRYPIGELRLLPGGAYGLVVEVIDSSGASMGATEVVLGRGPFRDKLLRVEFILEHLFAQNKVAEYVLLDVGDDLDPRSVELAGARVVVKADLAVDPVEALDELVRHEASSPAPERAPRPDTPPAPTPEALPELEEPPPVEHPHAEETDAPSEAAPLTGGRPAEELGQE
jgi:hypothetical protein